MASKSALKNRLLELEKSISLGDEIHIKVDGFSFEIYGSGRNILYKPSETAERFHSSPALIKGMMGPVGSGKTSALCAHLVLRAVNMPRCKDGVRRYRCILVRNTYSELLTTTLNTWMDWYRDLGHATLNKSSPIEYFTRFSDGNGVIEMRLYFISNDREEQVKKFDSLETTDFLISEIRHVPLMSMLGKAQERISRYPAKNEIGNFRGGIFFDTNPPKLDSDFFRLFEKEKPSDFELFKQPPGLIKVDGEYMVNPNADNIMNLSEGYYLDAAKGKSEEHIKIMIMGEYGISEDHRRIYHEYNDDLHSVDHIEYIENRPVYIGVDYETLPSVTFCQVTQNGRILLIKELAAEKNGFKSFCQNILMPYINSTLRGYEIIATDDPAGNAMKPTDEKTCRMILAEFGIKAHAAWSNSLEPRMGSVRDVLNDMIDGKPRFCLSRRGVPLTREGFLGGYHYHTVKTAEGIQSTGKPEKNNFADVHDSLQYNIMGILGRPQQKTTMKVKLRRPGVFL